MNNEIGRKITSLTLMTIMLAGGMTIGFSGFTPDAYAVNANLLVSAENTGYVDGAQIVEILVIDDDLSGLPDITVNGDAVAMTATTDGNWYAYIADTDAVADVDNDATVTPAQSGIDFGIVCDITDSDASQSYCNADNTNQNVPAAEKDATDVTLTTWPFIQTYSFSSTIEIQYNKAGGTQITTLSFDDNADGLSLDRSDYPLGATVHVTIGDHRLNIDPTSADLWTWNMDNGDKYYGAVVEGATVTIDGTTTTANTIGDNQKTNQVCTDCTVSITPNRLDASEDATKILVVSEVENRPLPANTIASDGTATPTTVAEWFTVREIDGPNTAVFSSTNLSEESILGIADDAIRGSSALITYGVGADADDTDVNVKHSEATIEIQSPDDVWTSGLAIPIVIVDGDVNKNSRDSNDVDLTDPDSIIPTLITGEPFTLSKISSATWIGWSVDHAEAITLLARDGTTADQSLYNDTANAPFELKGFSYNATTDAYEDTDDDLDNNTAVLQNSATAISYDRANLHFYTLVNGADDPDTKLRLSLLT